MWGLKGGPDKRYGRGIVSNRWRNSTEIPCPLVPVLSVSVTVSASVSIYVDAHVCVHMGTHRDAAALGLDQITYIYIYIYIDR